MARPATTLLLITRDVLCRADFSGGKRPRMLHIRQQPRPAELDTLPSAVDAAIVGTRTGKKVCVLSSDLWTQKVSLAHGRMSGISEAELANALSFEAEAMSGVSAFESAIGYSRSSANDGQPTYWITQCTQGELAQIETVVTRAGGSLAGVMHPAGVPKRLPPDTIGGQSSASWQRVELWPDAVVCVRSTGSQAESAGLDVEVINADPSTGHWWEQVHRWAGDSAADGTLATLLAADLAGQDLPEQQPLLDVRRDDDVATWLQAWAEHVHDPDIAPVITMPPRSMSNQAYGLISASLMAASIALVFGLHSLLTQRADDADHQLNELKKPAAEIASLKSQTGKARKDQASLEEQIGELRGDLAAWRDAVHTQRRRPVALLNALAKLRPTDLVVEQIEDEQGEVRMAGVCLRPELANRLADALRRGLRGEGWSVSPATKKAAPLTADGGPWNFEITLRPTHAPPRDAMVSRAPVERNGGSVLPQPEGGRP